MSKKYNVGLVAGSFDIIHPGYVRMLADAKEQCLFLIVALHDNPRRFNKNKLPPVLSLQEREEILRSIKYVDHVVYYSTEDQLAAIIKEIAPDVRILGDDYQDKRRRITGADPEIPIHFHRRDHTWSATRMKILIAKSVQEAGLL